MEIQQLEKNCLPVDARVSDVLEVLNDGVFGIALMLDADKRLVGIFTDGDVRRAVLAGAKLDDGARRYMNTGFSFARESQGHQTALGMLSANRRHIPIVDDQTRPVDMVSLTEIWKLSVASPSLGGNEFKYVADCLKTGWISSQGEYVKKFENALSEYFGVENALAVSNGTSALQLALAALDIGEGDEVLVPNVTFGATANAVIHCGAKPVFVDIDPQHWCMDPDAMKKAITPKTRAVIPVHLYGHPADMREIMRISEENKLFVIEDCAEAIGAKVDARSVGAIGDIGCFSFFANKIITTGEGGAVISRHPHIVEKMKLLMNHGMDPKRRYWHLEPGFNFRMTNMQAAIGLAQMERIENFLEQRNALAERYHEGLASLDWLELPATAPWATRVHWLYSVRVKPDAPVSRDELIQILVKLNIETREIFPPLNTQPAFGSGPSQLFPVSSDISATSLSLPTSVEMSEKMIDHVITSLHQIDRKYNS